MKIEAGRFYRARNGIIYGPMIRVPGKLRLPFRVENVALDWREDGFFQSDRLESEHDLISEVYVSDTPPAEALAPKAKPLRDEFAMWLMNRDMFAVGFKDEAEQLYRVADAMMEARKVKESFKP